VSSIFVSQTCHYVPIKHRGNSRVTFNSYCIMFLNCLKFLQKSVMKYFSVTLFYYLIWYCFVTIVWFFCSKILQQSYPHIYFSNFQNQELVYL
jgi:hypothetical protein